MTENLFEIEWRKALIAKLVRVQTTMNKAAAAEEEAANVRRDELRQYQTKEEAQEAYGYGDISLEEYRAIVDDFESNPTITVMCAARDDLREYINRLRREIRDFEWAMLPDEEKERIHRRSAEEKAALRKRRERHELDL